MDRGEAEALAQNQFYDNLYSVILDEKIARRIARGNDMQIRGTLSLLADMDILYGMVEYYPSVMKLQTDLGTFFSPTIVDLAYKQAQKRAG